jgi:hypothetical protein
LSTRGYVTPQWRVFDGYHVVEDAPAVREPGEVAAEQPEDVG